jgi:hypothetical protein
VIKVGNSLALAMPCVVIDVDVSHKTFHITSVSHHPSCNIDENMEHGRAGTIQMMHLALMLAKHLFPSYKKVELMDTSGYHDVVAGFNVNLADKDFFFSGSTWYQKHLGALNLKPLLEKNVNYIQELKRFLETHPSSDDATVLRRDYDLKLSKSKNYFENLQILKTKLGGAAIPFMFALQNHFHLMSLYGMVWIGSMDTPNPFDIPFQCEQIKRPRKRDLKAQWGGQIKLHQSNNVK